MTNRQKYYFIDPDYKGLRDPQCLHMTCTACHGSGRKADGSYCVHALSCPCPTCSPGSLNIDRRVTC